MFKLLRETLFCLLIPKFQVILTSDCSVMLHFMTYIEGAWDRHHRYDNQFFQRSFAKCLVVSAFKVSNDLDKYLARYSIIKDCLESDVHHMTSQILSIFQTFKGLSNRTIEIVMSFAL